MLKLKPFSVLLIVLGLSFGCNNARFTGKSGSSGRSPAPTGENPGDLPPPSTNPNGDQNLDGDKPTGTPGATNPGGSNPGGSNPGGSNPGGSNPGGSNPGGSNPGGSNPGGSNPGGSNPGASKPSNPSCDGQSDCNQPAPVDEDCFWFGICDGENPNQNDDPGQH